MLTGSFSFKMQAYQTHQKSGENGKAVMGIRQAAGVYASHTDVFNAKVNRKPRPAKGDSSGLFSTF